MEEPSSEPRETKPANLVALKTAACSLRDTISQSEKEEEWRGKGRSNGKNIDKHRRQLAELEAQLVLASPHLLFQVTTHSTSCRDKNIFNYKAGAVGRTI